MIAAYAMITVVCVALGVLCITEAWKNHEWWPPGYTTGIGSAGFLLLIAATVIFQWI